MINIDDAKPGLHCFYQKPHMRSPEYGIITQVTPRCFGPSIVHVRFLFDTIAKPCLPGDLHWPPDFCAIHGGNPPGQIFGHYPSL